ncbi:MAG TPA: hypothetical protein VFJ72_14755, partial [Rubrobacteraceae bacterium]|nr:hypothetical protein [Rubrobacteraceae bacterium]
MTPAKTLKVRRWDRGARLLAALLLLLAAALLVSQSPALVQQAGAQTSGPSSLVVKDLKTGDPIANFNYTINADNVGDPADPANMPSVIKGQSNSPVAAVGDQGSAGSVDLDPGKYVASVSADGYKLGGEHFSAGDTVTVLLEPEPKAGLDPSRLAKIRVHAFEDNRMVNGENDAPLESGLEGFDVVIKDEVGHVTQDYYGNAIGTEYEKDANGDLVLDPNGQPIPVPNTGGNILTDANGDAVVENLAPGKYGVQVIAPDGSGWIQTSTLEGTHTIDAWIDEGNDGTISEVPGVSPSPMAEIGFVKEQSFANPGSGSIKGRARTALEYITEAANPPLGDPVKSPYIALTALDLNDELSYLGRGNPDGTFDIQNVPDGKYQLTIWDEPMDYIISFRTATVSGGNVVDMGDIGVPRWFGKTLGTVFEDNGKDGNGNPITRADGTDAAGNQILDCDQNDPNSCEKGLPGVDVGTRYKDGSTQYGTLTDAQGHYALNETFPLGRFTVAEVSNVRYAPTGASVRSEYNGTDLKSLSVPGALLMSTFSWTGKNYIDWGKKRYTGSENGGISGIVYYATMRTEENARYQSGDPYEPGVPGVKVDLYQADTDANGDPIKEADGSVKTKTADPIATVNTDSWQQPTGCDVLDENGNTPTDPAYAPTAQQIADNCLEVPALGNETRDGVFDGGYAFSTYTDPSDGQTKPLPPGDYVVKMRIPKDKNGNDLYKIVKEEDVNIEKGENFVPQVPPPPCAGALHTVNDPRQGPYDGQQMPLCDSKLVHLNAQQNAGADFFMFTDTPIPGRVWGLVTDDLNIETDPSLLYYGDKKGIAHIPVGVYDHTGRLIQTVYTDDNGIFETILPSTGTFNVPTPSGVSPNMYTFLANDPGPDPNNPNPVQGPGTVMGYDPNYSTLPLIYDVWPGKTTAADMAILPNTPGGDPGGAQAGEPEDGAPDVQNVQNPVVQAAGARNLVIKGKDFGAAPQVTLDGKQITVNSMSGDTQINAAVPAGFPVGPHELLVKSGGRTSATGLKVHVLGTSGKTTYRPTVIRVNQGQKIQDAINRASGNTLIVVGPGTYNENLIVHKGVKLQGVGPGSVTINGSYVDAHSAAWHSLLGSVNFDGDRNVNEGSAITVLAKAGQFTPTFRPSIDGFTIKGGRGDSGGGIFVNGYGRYLDISNNVIQGNRGYYGGAVTLGRPYSGDAHNTNVRIRYNRVL